MSIVERVWFGDDLFARTARGLLHPASRVYAMAVARRNAHYDRDGRDATPRMLLPTLSIGNLTVGGTGKTPVAAWCVAELRKRGANPAVVMRGYGDDEWRVHTLLNRGTHVVVSPDRVAGVLTARTRGADSVVLDDAFQHRRAARLVDLVLLSVDRWSGTPRLLPAGPFREGLAALQRASLVVLTHKSNASTARRGAVCDAVRAAAPDVRIADVRLTPGNVRLATSLLATGSRPARPSAAGEFVHPPSWLSGRRLVAVSAIGDHDAFAAQLEQLGAVLIAHRRFRDHHMFTDANAAAIARAATSGEDVICTLKDAVKLAPVWPREAPPLWYVSQTLVVERGADLFAALLDRIVAARVTTLHPAG